MGVVISQITSGSPGWPVKVTDPGLSACICAKMVCADTALPAAVSSAIALLASAPAFGSVMPNSGPWVVVCGQEVRDVLGEPVGRQVAVLGVVPFGREVEVVRTHTAAMPGLPAVAVREPGLA